MSAIFVPVSFSIVRLIKETAQLFWKCLLHVCLYYTNMHVCNIKVGMAAIFKYMPMN